jgi:hypothetical protein
MAEQAPGLRLQTHNIANIFEHALLNVPIKVPTNNISNKVNQGYKGLTEDGQWISSVQEKKHSLDITCASSKRR